MKYVERRFTQLHPHPQQAGREARPFSAFAEHPTIVVLGDPGLGKTRSLMALADADSAASFVTVRKFLHEDFSVLRGRILYLDALDEQRSRRKSGRDVLDEVIERLRLLGKPRFRLSCRANDWYDTIDIDELTSVSPDGNVCVLRLEPLDDSDIVEIIADEIDDPKGFIEAAWARGADGLLVNPETLRLLVNVVRTHQWPRTRTELFEFASRILVQESNQVHGRSDDRQIEINTILDAAGLLCALQLTSDIEGFALTVPVSDMDFVASTRVPGKIAVTQAALTSRLFHADTPEKVRPAHRTTAEFLAARYLASRISQGDLPFGRALALITGNDGGTLTELRGLYAWFTAMCTAHRIELSARDPLGVILYGDVAPFSTSEKEALLNSLADLERRNPYFRAEDWSSRPFGALATSDMEFLFRRLLTTADVPPGLLLCALQALGFGPEMPNLAPALIHFIRSSNQFRAEALNALIKTYSGDVADLKALLDEIQDGKIPDEDRQLRGLLLSSLYPTTIGPGNVARYLVPEAQSVAGDYWQFLNYLLLPRTPSEMLPALANACVLAGVFANLDFSAFGFRNLAGKLLIALLKNHGAVAPASALYAWLQIGVGKYYESQIDEGEAKEIGTFIDDHPKIYWALLRHHLETIPVERLWLGVEHDFREFVHHAAQPPHRGRFLLEFSLTTPDMERAIEVFDVAIRSSWRDITDPTIEELWLAADQRPNLKAKLGQLSVIPVSDDDFDRAKQKKERRLQEEQDRMERRKRARANLSAKREGILNGSEWGCLDWFARIYFGKFSDSDRELSPRERLVEELDSDIVNLAEAGLDACLRSSALPTPEQLGELPLRNMRSRVTLPVLAAIDRLLVRDSVEALVALVDSTIACALIAQLMERIGEKPKWVGVVISRRPELAEKTLVSFWGAAVAAKSPQAQGLHEVNTATYEPIAGQVAITLLERYADIETYAAHQLLTASLQHSEHSELLAIARSRLAQKPVLDEEPHTLWIVAAVLLAPDEFGQALQSWISGNADRAWVVIEFAPAFVHDGVVSDADRPHALEILVRALGAIFPPADMTFRERVGSRHPEDASRIIASLIDRLGGDLQDAAEAALRRTIDDPALAPWVDRLTYVWELRVRKLRDARARTVSFEDAVQTLSGGAPVNAADLQSIASEELRLLAREIRHGNLDGYKMFWNVTSTDVVDPVPEEIARDRLISLLKPRLNRFGVTVESEARYAENKRADVRLSYGSLSIPLEAKRNYHRDLWTAPEAQLKRLYMRDPGAGDRGIYLVFWFGHDKPAWRTPRAPGTGERPESAQGLEMTLHKRLPLQDLARLEFIVIDCAAPKPVRKNNKTKAPMLSPRAKKSDRRVHASRAKKTS